jgi:FMN phosphatase YigB (HAD superfamily)
MRLRDKVIVTDVDGVLLDWSYAYNRWMIEKGYESKIHDEYDISTVYGVTKEESRKLVRQFNESATTGWLPAFRDSIKYVKKIHEDKGYVFHAVTSMSTNRHAVILRKMNLRRLFGENIFEKIECLDTGADKDEALEEYRDSGVVWVEDKVKNADLGVKMGLHSILMDHIHNRDTDHLIKVANWKEIYEMV